MPWSALVAPVLIAGDIRIDSSGLKLYSGTPGASPIIIELDEFGNIKIFNSGGQTIYQISQGADGAFVYQDAGPSTQGALLASMAGKAGSDNLGFAYEEGLAAYVDISSVTYALRLGLVTVNGPPTPALFLDEVSGGSAPNDSPAYSFGNASSSGTATVTYSGKATSGATPSYIECADSVLSGTAGGAIVISSGTISVDASGNTVIAGTLSVNGSSNTGSSGLADGTINGSSSTAGLTNGTINGTSGGASAGTAHTHGSGSYAVANGQHSHSSGSYAVANGSHSHVL